MAPRAPPAPQIEGVLKSVINSVGFGLITTVLSITFGRIFIPNFFVCIVSFVIFIEVVLLICIPKRKVEYELYQAQGRKGIHSIEGADAPQINIQGPDEYGSPKKKGGIRERFHKKQDNKKDLLRPEDNDPAGMSSGHGQTGSPKRSPKMERKESPKVAKPDAKEKRDESKGKPETAEPEERDDEKSAKNKGKGSWRRRLPQRKSQSEESA